MHRILITIIVSLISPATSAESKELNFSDSEYIGKEIYKKDWLAWQATDFLLERNILQNDPNVKGWVTDTSVKPYAVHFMGITNNEPNNLHSVIFNEKWEPSYTKDIKTEIRHKQMYLARSAALENLEIQCSPRYNTVVIPAMNGWIVYALASTTEPGVIVIGGHNRITFNQQGTEVLKSEKLYSSCMNMNPSDGLPEGAKPAGLTVTDNLNLYPTEAMVFLSIQHNLPLFVATTSNAKIWEVNKGKIKAIEK